MSNSDHNKEPQLVSIHWTTSDPGFWEDIEDEDDDTLRNQNDKNYTHGSLGMMHECVCVSEHISKLKVGPSLSSNSSPKDWTIDEL